jgi:hypothetical protein
MSRLYVAFALLLLPTVLHAEPRVLKVGTKPESVCRGFEGKLYVTVINGDEPGDGGVNVIDGDKVSDFCRGMNSPKGMVFLEDLLIIADETTVWKVDAHGKATKLAEKKDFPRPIEFLNDVAANPFTKTVYVTDMSNPSWMFDPSGERKLWPVDSEQAKCPKTGCLYEVTLDGKVTEAAPPGDPLLTGPNGVAFMGTAKSNIVVLGDFFTGNLVMWDGKAYRTLATGMRGADGLQFGNGGIFVSSWPLGKVWKYDRKTKEVILLSDDFTTAADLFYDRKNKQLIVPDMLEGTLTFLPVPQ